MYLNIYLLNQWNLGAPGWFVIHHSIRSLVCKTSVLSYSIGSWFSLSKKRLIEVWRSSSHVNFVLKGWCGLLFRRFALCVLSIWESLLHFRYQTDYVYWLNDTTVSGEYKRNKTRSYTVSLAGYNAILGTVLSKQTFPNLLLTTTR